MTFTGELLPYQHEAVDMMVSRGNALVAYDLGLGKTVLTIAAIERLMDESRITEPGLVICLSSLKYQWAAQIEKFTSGTSKALVIDGTPTERKAQYEKAINWSENQIDYVVMNYEQVVNDFDFVRQLPRGFVVADEATAIKSFKSKRSKAVKVISSKFNFALTGTPVENGKAEELFSIMQFVDPKVLGSWGNFDYQYIVRNHFGGVQRYKNLDVLNKKLSTACVRKRQEDPDVSPYLPETIYAEPIWVPMDRNTKQLYRRIALDLLSDLEDVVSMFGNVDIFSFDSSDGGGPLDELRGRLMPKLIAMRMICDHPVLLKTSGSLYRTSHGVDGSGYAHELLDSGALEKVNKSPKMDVLYETVDEFLGVSPKNKVVIFTSFVSMVDMIAESLDKFGVRKYTGKMSAVEKENAKVEFQTDPDIRVLVSSDAGGYGVDLPQANMLINYDLPWNAGLAAQRNGRIRRASSEWKHVYIQDILIKDSIEQRQYDMLQQKMAVASAIVDGEGITADGGVSVTLDSLRQFLLDM